MLRRGLRSLAAVALLVAVGSNANADQGWTQPQNAHQNPVYNLPAPSGPNAATEPLILGSHPATTVLANPTGSTGNVQDVSCSTPGTFLGNGAGVLSCQLIPGSSITGFVNGATVFADGINTGTTQLASISAASMGAGVIAAVASVDDMFSLQASTLTTDGITVIAASGKAGYQWIRLGIPSLKWYGQTTWYLDPTSGSDEAAGTVGVPIKTAAEFYRRTKGTTATSVTVNVLNDLPDSDVVNWSPGVVSSLILQGAPAVAATVTIASAVAPIYASAGGPPGALNQVNVTSFDWSPYVGNLVRLHGTSGSTGTYAVVAQNLGGGGALIGPQVVNNVTQSTGFTATQVLDILTYPRVPGVVGAQAASTIDLTELTAGTATTSASSIFRTAGPGGWFFNRCHVGGNGGFVTFSGNGNISLLTTGVRHSSSFSAATLGGLSTFEGTVFANTGTVSLASGSNSSLRDSVFYSSPIVMGNSSQLSATLQGPNAIGVGIFGLSAGQSGIYTGQNSTLTSGWMFGASNDSTSSFLSIDRTSRLQHQAAGTAILSELTSAGVKMNAAGSSASNGEVIPNSFAGYEFTFDRGQNGSGPTVASTNNLIPLGLTVFNSFNVTGTTALKSMGIAPESNGVSLLPDGFEVTLFIVNGLTIQNNAAAVTFVTVPFLLAGGADYVAPAGSWITFRFTRQSAWVEKERSGAGASYYGEVESNNVILTQQPILNFGVPSATGLSATNNGSNHSTDVVNTLVTGLAGGQTAVGGTASGDALTLKGTTNSTPGPVKVVIGTSAGQGLRLLRASDGLEAGEFTSYLGGSAGPLGVNLDAIFSAPMLSTNELVNNDGQLTITSSLDGPTGSYGITVNSAFGNGDATGYQLAIFPGASQLSNPFGVFTTGGVAALQITPAGAANFLGPMTVSSLGTGFVKATSGLFSIDTTSYVPTTRTVQGTAPIQIAGGNTAVDLSANRVWSLSIDSTLVVASSALGRAAISGDGSIAAGSNTFALSNIPNGTTAVGDINFTGIAAPASPATAHGLVYFDSTSLNLAVKNASGVVNHGIQSNAGASHEWVAAIADNGSVTLSQPSYTDLLGSVPAITQLTGDVTAGPGSGSQVATISANAVTNSKFRQSAANSLVGNPTGSTANVSDIPVNLPLGFSGGNLILDYDGSSLVTSGPVLLRAALTGDITAGAGLNTTAFRSFAALSVLARAASSSGVPTELTATANNQVLQELAGVLTFHAFDYSQLTGTPSLTITLGGDVTGSGATGTTIATTIANISTGATDPGFIDFTETAAPTAPVASHLRVWGDSTADNWFAITHGGTKTHGIQSVTLASHNFATATTDAGGLSGAQPAFTDLSGAESCAQQVALTGDLTTSGCAATLANSGVSAGTYVTPTITVDAKGRIISASFTNTYQGVEWDGASVTAEATLNFQSPLKAADSGGSPFRTNVSFLKDANFTTNGSNQLALANQIGINGPTLPNNTSFVVGKTNNSDFDRVQFFVGGGTLGATGTGNDSLFEIFPGTVNVRSGVTSGTYAVQTIDAATYHGGSGQSVLNLASLYIPDAPASSSLTVSGGRYGLLIGGSGGARIAGTVRLDSLASLGTLFVTADSAGDLGTSAAQHSAAITYSLNTLNTTALCGGWLYHDVFESGNGCGGGFSTSALEFPTGGLVPQTVHMQVEVYSLTMSGTYNLKLVVTRNGTAISPTACNFSSSSGSPPFMCDQGPVGVSSGSATDTFGVEAVATGSGTASAFVGTVNLTVQDY